MSKRIIIMDAPDSATSIEQIGDENPYFLGAFGEVIAVLKQIFPKGDFSDPTDITATTDNGTVKIEIAKHTPVQSFMIILENEGDIKLVEKLCEKTNWRALDTDTGKFIDKNAKKHNNSRPKDDKKWWKFWSK